LIKAKVVYFVDENTHLFAEHKKCTDKIYGSILDGFYEGPNIWTLLALRLADLGYSAVHVQSVKQVMGDFSCIVITNIKLKEMKYIAEHHTMFPVHKLVLTMWEPPTVNPYNYYPKFHLAFDKILTWADDIVDNKKYLKFFYPRQELYMIPYVIPFHKKKLCCMVAGLMQSTYEGELYSERLKTVEYFEQCSVGEFDLYGERGYKDRSFRSYKGCVPHKIETLKKYRFCICYENVKGLNGYVTEKIFDCFHAGCVPVYWGAENIEQYIPAHCFIDRRKFAGNEELYCFLKQMNAEDYEKYLEAIEDYLAFDLRAQWFSVDNFITIMCNVITGITKQ
jgi:hypothetical protein